jgi:serine/threonine-protein kinase RsbW
MSAGAGAGTVADTGADTGAGPVAGPLSPPAARHPGRAAGETAPAQAAACTPQPDQAGSPSGHQSDAPGAADGDARGLSGTQAAILVESMASTSRAVRAALQRLCARAAGLGLSAEDCMTLEIVLAEALNNIVEHSYRERPSGWILAEAEWLDGRVVCRLTDGGRAMPGGTLPAAAGDPADRAASLPEGGFGWQMIRDLARDVTYAREGEVNRLLFSLPVGTLPVGTLPVGPPPVGPPSFDPLRAGAPGRPVSGEEG